MVEEVWQDGPLGVRQTRNVEMSTLRTIVSSVCLCRVSAEMFKRLHSNLDCTDFNYVGERNSAAGQSILWHCRELVSHLLQGT